MLPLATDLPKITQMLRSALHSTGSRFLDGQERNKKADVSRRELRPRKVVQKSAELRRRAGTAEKERPGRREIAAASTPAVQRSVVSLGLLPQSTPRHQHKPRVCRPERVYAPGQDPFCCPAHGPAIIESYITISCPSVPEL